MQWQEDLDKAVRFRESGELAAARELFQSVLLATAGFKDSSSVADKNEYVGILGQWIIQLRLEGKASYQTALEEALKSYEYFKKENLDTPHAIRGLAHTLMNLEQYELARPYLEEMVSLTNPDQSTTLGDAQAHLARCLFRIGKSSDAKELIDVALENIDKNTGQLQELPLAANKTHALLVKALILSSSGNSDEAKILVDEAMALAVKNGLQFRIQEIQKLLQVLTLNG